MFWPPWMSLPSIIMEPPTPVCQEQVEDVVQAERNEGTFNDTEDEGPDVARTGYQTAEGKDAVLDDGPDEVHGNADEHVDDGRDDRNETGAAEER